MQLRADDYARVSENGGPGAPNSPDPQGWGTAEAAGESLGPFTDLHPIFDLVGLDMRGTGASVPVLCDPDNFNNITWPTIKDEKTYDDMISRSKAWGESCVDMTGPLIHHMGTDQAIRDLDMLREALGYNKTNFLGFSYGTQFGSEYAELFPDKVDKMVLDGIFDRHLPDESFITTYAAGLESVVDDFFHWCNATADCALHGRDSAAIFDAVYAATESSTLKAESESCNGAPCNHGGIANTWEFVFLTVTGLHDYMKPNSPANWYTYASNLEAAFDKGNGSAFIGGATTANSSSLENLIYSELIIICSDRARRRMTWKDYLNVYQITELIAPHTRGGGIAQQFASICTGWPIESSNPPHDLDPKQMNKLPPVLLVNAFYDPATASPWGLFMRQQIPTGHTIYRNGGGHTSWPQNGATTNAINAYLVNGTLPAEGTVYPS